jgi:quercetin dioxygenase-like cupin family protein
MNALRNLAVLGAGAVLAAVPFLVSAQSESAKAQQARIAGKTLIAFDEMKWVPMTGLEGAQQAALFGDSTKESHRILYKWPAGTKAPMHTHTHGDRGVVISGTLSLAVDGAPAKHLGPGSFFSLAGGIKHATAAEGSTPCVFYIEREGPFDATMRSSGPAGGGEREFGLARLALSSEPRSPGSHGLRRTPVSARALFESARPVPRVPWRR